VELAFARDGVVCTLAVPLDGQPASAELRTVAA
jgi:hypothetical protein